MTTPTMPARTVFETTDPDQVNAFLQDNLGSVRMTGMRPGRCLRVTRVDAGAFRLGHAQLPVGALRFDVGPLGLFVVGAMAGGGVERVSGAQREMIGPRGVFLSSYPDAAARIIAHDLTDHYYAVLTPDLIAQVAGSKVTGLCRPVRFVGLSAVSEVAARQWRTTYGYVDMTLSDPAVLEQPLVVGAAGRMLAAAALTTFPNTALVDPTAQDRRDANGITIRRAMTYIEEHAADDVSVADIAGAAAVTIRAVQLAFRRHLGTTPMTYVREVRLAHVHRELLQADPAVRTVAEIAARWGFTNHSRFTASYRQIYGVLPSHTLKRG